MPLHDRLQAPENLQVDLVDGRRVRLSWDRVQCSTAYKVMYKLGQEDEEGGEQEEQVTQSLGQDFEDLLPCTTYYYSVATLVGEQGSEATQWASVEVPPNLAAAPILKVVNNESDNITLRLDPDPSNQRCQAEEYQVKDEWGDFAPEPDRYVKSYN